MDKHPCDQESILEGINCPVLFAAFRNSEEAMQEYVFQTGVGTTEEVAAAKQRLHTAGELFRLVLEYHHKHVS
jgi:hypothetical protein